MTTLSPDVHVRIPSHVYARAFGDEIVLLDFGRGEYFGLDEVGAEIWKRLEAGDALSEIARRLVDRYEVSPDQALDDVRSLVSQMASESLVELA